MVTSPPPCFAPRPCFVHLRENIAMSLGVSELSRFVTYTFRARVYRRRTGWWVAKGRHGSVTTLRDHRNGRLQHQQQLGPIPRDSRNWCRCPSRDYALCNLNFLPNRCNFGVILLATRVNWSFDACCYTPSVAILYNVLVFHVFVSRRRSLLARYETLRKLRRFLSFFSSSLFYSTTLRVYFIWESYTMLLNPIFLYRVF